MDTEKASGRDADPILNVFISHNKGGRRKEYAQLLFRELNESTLDKFTVMVDEYSSPGRLQEEESAAGADFRSVLEERVGKADVLIALMDTGYFRRPVCWLELNTAFRRRIPLILLSTVDVREFEDLSQREDFVQEYPERARVLQDHLEHKIFTQVMGKKGLVDTVRKSIRLGLGEEPHLVSLVQAAGLREGAPQGDCVDLPTWNTLARTRVETLGLAPTSAPSWITTVSGRVDTRMTGGDQLLDAVLCNAARRTEDEQIAWLTAFSKDLGI